MKKLLALMAVLGLMSAVALAHDEKKDEAAAAPDGTTKVEKTTKHTKKSKRSKKGDKTSEKTTDEKTTEKKAD
ncbi:MAG: hypothetical protein HY075_08005 [Deltaproteobacteria bacterium]|nr:hypothetical protein [Deltaproteobacteria bacterium]